MSKRKESTLSSWRMGLMKKVLLILMAVSFCVLLERQNDCFGRLPIVVHAQEQQKEGEITTETDETTLQQQQKEEEKEEEMQQQEDPNIATEEIQDEELQQQQQQQEKEATINKSTAETTEQEQQDESESTREAKEEVIVEDETLLQQQENDVDDNEEVIDLDQQEQSSETATAQNATTTTTTTMNSPFEALLGPSLLSIQMTGNSAQVNAIDTATALKGKKVVALYFAADWCGPCRQFSPQLVQFYKRINQQRGRKDSFQVVWISRSRDVNSFGQYYATALSSFLALPPELALGPHGQTVLGQKFGVKGIPSLILLDENANVITTQARQKLAQDMAGIGFPWHNPIVKLYRTLFPKTLRFMLIRQARQLQHVVVGRFQSIIVRPLQRKLQSLTTTTTTPKQQTSSS